MSCFITVERRAVRPCLNPRMVERQTFTLKQLFSVYLSFRRYFNAQKLNSAEFCLLKPTRCVTVSTALNSLQTPLIYKCHYVWLKENWPVSLS